MKARNWLLGGLTLLVLLFVNFLVVQKEWLLARGQVVYLELAPVDPRSLIQGDYMRLRYAIATPQAVPAATTDGYMVVQLDDQNVARYVRIYDPQTPLAPNELLLRFRMRNRTMILGANSFFFQEGQGQYYRNARYGELRLTASGDLLLVGLRGASLEKLGPP